MFRDRAELTGPNGGPIQTEDLSRIPDDQLAQMRQWLIDARAARSVDNSDHRLASGAVDSIIDAQAGA